MTLYSKWTRTENLLFITCALCVIAILFRWFNSMAELRELFSLWGEDRIRVRDLREIQDWVRLLSPEDADQMSRLITAYQVNGLRFLFLLPLVYPLATLFVGRRNKNITCTCLLVLFAAALIFAIVCRQYYNVLPWLLALLSLLAFASATLIKPEEQGAGQAAPQSVFCPACGTANAAGDRFCDRCGKSLTE